jgi:hypothetical protein
VPAFNYRKREMKLAVPAAESREQDGYGASGFCGAPMRSST